MTPLVLLGTALAMDATLFRAPRVGLRVGLDPAVEVGLDGSLPLPASLPGRGPLTAEMELATPIFVKDGAGSLEGRLSTPLTKGPWDARVGLELGASTVDDGSARVASLSMGASVTPGWYGERGFVALPLRYRWTALSWRSFHEDYRAMVPSAVDGWYGGLAQWTYVAAAGGLRLGAHWDVGMELGGRFWPGPTSPYYLPWFVGVGVGWRMGG